MAETPRNPVTYLELQTGDLRRACGFYTRLFGWRAETIRVAEQSYLTLDIGDCLDAGAVERDTEPCLWLPYVAVDDITATTGRARMLGATVLLPPREGPAGWRSILEAPAGGRIALWQPKR